MKSQKSILIIVCYFGKFPWYFKYFVHSCLYNPTIDFFIITDQNILFSSLPTNVTILNKSLNDINTLAQQKLNLSVNISNAYKLCDFKPAYGLLFPEIIKEYDFWGHGDIDVIFGNIRNFMTDEILNNHDVICVRHDFLTGYFTLFKNCRKNNELYKYSKDYEKVLSCSRHFCFDETNFAFLQFEQGVPLDEIESEVESMTYVVKKLHEQKIINAYFDFHVIEGTPGRLKWNNGMLTYKNKFEVMLYHLIKLKTIYHPAKPPKRIPDVFYISPTKIYS
ncbi:MAG: DUF6625 family protein [Chitinophagaceae bacterium]